MTTDILLAVGVMMGIGLLGGLLAKRLNFPRVTGYIIIGVLLSPSLLNLMPRASVDNLEIFTSAALAIIAYAIGGTLHFKTLRKLGKSSLWITPMETLGAWLICTLLLFFLLPVISGSPELTAQNPFPMALVAGSISGATAPAATMAVVREYKAKGPFTTTLLSVVALDDALSIVIFAIAIAIATSLQSGVNNISFSQMFGTPFLDIAKSIGVGTGLGFALIKAKKFMKSRSLLLVLILAVIMLCTGIINRIGGSLILANMVVGFVVLNKSSEADASESFAVIHGIEDVVYAVFFVLAGMHFDTGVIKSAGLIALLIIVGRFVGQYAGAAMGAKISNASESVRKYLGLALQAQAGVTVGLALIIRDTFPTFGDMVFNGFLASIIISELFAPLLVKYAIFKSGEATVEEPTAVEAH